MKQFKIIFWSFALLAALLAGQWVLAADNSEQEEPPALHNCPPNISLQQCQELYLNQIGQTSGYGTSGAVQSTTLSQKIGVIISYVLGFVGIIFFILIIVSGIQWMTTSDNEKIAHAQGMIKNAIIGLLIVLTAYAITYFVVSQLNNSVRENSNSQPVNCSSFTTQEDCISNSQCYWWVSGSQCLPQP